MILSLSFDEKTYDVDVPEKLMADAQDLYLKLNKDMDQGWQVSREWVESLTTETRCQIVADKIMNAFQDENEQLVILLSGYILNQMPNIKAVSIDTSGDVTQTMFG